MDERVALEMLKRIAAALDVLEELAAAAKSAGAWRTWTFDRQVWYLRKHHRITQTELSRRSGVSQRRISRIEAGEDVKMSPAIPQSTDDVLGDIITFGAKAMMTCATSSL